MRPRWPSTEAMRRPVAASQSRSVPSWPHEASVVPSGEKAMDVTVSSWRSRSVPTRMTAPCGRGSPSRSTGGSWTARSAARPRMKITSLYYAPGGTGGSGLLDVADDDFRRAVRHDVVLADLGGNEEAFALPEGLGAALLVAEGVLALAVDDGVDDAAGGVGLLRDALVAELDGLHRELLALDQELAPVREAEDARRLVLRHAHRVEVGDVHRLLDVEGARLLVGPHAAPVREPVGGVGVLLHFKEDDASVRGVDGAGRDEDDVLLLDVHHIQALLDGARLEVGLELGDRGAGQDAADHARFLRGVEDIPGLHLADPFGLVALRVVVRGMHLERETVVAAEELDQERVALEAHRVLVAEHVLAVELEELLQRPALVRAVGHDAGVLVALRDLPRLAAAFAGALLGHDLGELRPAPDLVLVDFLEAEGITRRGTLGHGEDSRGTPRRCQCIERSGHRAIEPESRHA